MLMLKPGAIDRHIVGKLLCEFEAATPGVLDILALRLTVNDHDFLYPHSIGQEWRDRNVEHITSGRVILLEVFHHTWEYYRKVALDIRKRYGATGSDNLIHASDSHENSVRETAYFFGGKYHADAQTRCPHP